MTHALDLTKQMVRQTTEHDLNLTRYPLHRHSAAFSPAPYPYGPPIRRGRKAAISCNWMNATKELAARKQRHKE